MRNSGWLLVVSTLAVPSAATSADNTPPHERDVLDGALVLSGLSSTHLPVVLTPVRVDGASRGVDAWTVYDEHDKGQQIFVYTRGRTFQCASAVGQAQYQCMLRLASIIVHEAWHLKNGRDEASAYDAQLAFLERNGASHLHVLDVRRSRSRVLAEKQNARKKAHDDDR